MGASAQVGPSCCTGGCGDNGGDGGVDGGVDGCASDARGVGSRWRVGVEAGGGVSMAGGGAEGSSSLEEEPSVWSSCIGAVGSACPTSSASSSAAICVGVSVCG